MDAQTKVYLFITVFLTVFSLLLLNGGRVIYKAISSFKKINPYIYYSLFIVFFAFFIFVFINVIFIEVNEHSNSIFMNQTLIKMAHYVMGLIAYIIVFGNIANIVYLVVKISRNSSFMLNRYEYITKFGSAALLITISVLFIFGALNSNIIRLKKYDINLESNSENNVQLENSSSSLNNSVSRASESDEVNYSEKSMKNIKGMKIAVISDIHLGYVNDNNHLRKLVTKINESNPDIVMMPGDIFDDDYYAIDNPEETIKIFRSIKSKYGVYACLGNHDSGSSVDKMVELLDKSDVKLLNDDKVVIDNKFVLVGRLDPRPIGKAIGSRGDMPSLTEDEKALPVIVMDHQPNNIEEYENYADLIISGHTHDGQFFPFNLIVKKVYPLNYGVFEFDDNKPKVIVTSGAGTWGPPIRVWANSEVVEIVIE